MDVSFRAMAQGWAQAWLAIFCLVSCAREPDRPELRDPPIEVQLRYHFASERLLADHLENGWVVTRKPDGTPEHTGEGLLWSGVALASLTCEDGAAIEDMLIATVTRLDGALVRYEPLGEYEGGREVTLDGAIGFWRGVAHRVVSCPGSAEKWTPAVKLHLDYVERSKGRLHPNAKAVLPPGFDYVLHLLGHRLGLSGLPSGDTLDGLRTALALWAKATIDNRKPCYRVHLGLLMLESVEALGVGVSRETFCIASKGAGMPLVDHYCGVEQPLLDWVDNFEFNRFEFAHQRCYYETESVGDDQTPGLDFLVGVKHAYRI